MNALQRAAARQDIEYLRRLYGRATDLLGRGTPDAVAEGSAIYTRIFTPDADVKAMSGGKVTLRATGPDAWAREVVDALASYTVTQHLIGTQIVDIGALQVDSDGQVASGNAHMSSYLHAWHASPDRVWIVVGTYHDQVRFTPGTGWQIEAMTLDALSTETRPRGQSNAPRAD